MKSSAEDLDLLDRYISHSLNASEIYLIKERLEKEPDLAADYNELRIIIESLRVSTLNNKLKMLQELEASKKSVITDKTLKPKTWMIFLTGVVVLFVLFAVYYWYSQNKPELTGTEEQLIAESIGEDYILHKTMRSSNDTSGLSPEQRKAYDLYAIQEYNDAIPLLKEQWELNKDTLAYFYLGVSYHVTGLKDKAKEVFSDPALSENSIYNEKINKLEIK